MLLVKNKLARVHCHAFFAHLIFINLVHEKKLKERLVLCMILCVIKCLVPSLHCDSLLPSVVYLMDYVEIIDTFVVPDLCDRY